MDYSIEGNSFLESLDHNITGKKSSSGAEKSAKYLKTLYRFDIAYPPFLALKYFWQNIDTSDTQLLAFIYAIHHDYLLAESVDVLLTTKPEEKVSIESLEENIETYHPKHYSPNTRRSIAQNIASSWKQAGFIEGKVKNIRVQPEISFKIACFAFLLAYLKGERGDFIWNSIGVKALGLNESKLRELAIECAKRDLMQYLYAGNVTSISFSELLKKIGIDAV